eukprot:CAMPEP_0185703894 /NCGR_PEP_ID=MMETSP1164-20130828/15723_1 /TAXON_ID=1104430 /ORGANISM="Chrysoreinhardia sp, Strain CCMP2950" /LENGTH=318 /DNA_ID=CAMNT_0028371217 /DNA_START=9 /DNA_END=965 /DNA_ORIENTATION=-
MGCEAPAADQKLSYYTVILGIAVESICLIIALVGCFMGLGFETYRAAGALALTGAIAGVSTMSSYPCCCTRGRGRPAFVGFVALASVFTLIALGLAASAGNETPCVKHDCYWDAGVNGCLMCEDRHKDDCDPDRSYFCTHDDDAFLGYQRCLEVKYCSNWDDDCSKSGVDDDHWFWGYETKRDCEAANHVPEARRGSRAATLAATVIALVLRAVVVAVVCTAPVPPPWDPPRTAPDSSLGHGPAGDPSIPVVTGIELAPMVTVVRHEPYNSGYADARRAGDGADASGGPVVDDLSALENDRNLPHASLRGDVQYGIKA